MAPPTLVVRRVVGVSGVSAVALMLFGTRWGSYLGYAPLFLTDLLLAGGFLYWVAAEITFGKRGNRGRITHPGAPLALFLLFVIIRAVASPHALTMDWVRDVMPFLYAAVAFLSAATYAKAGAVGRAKTVRLLWWALNGHLAWTLVVNLGGLNPDGLPSLPGSGITVLTQRPDIDMAVLGMTAALYVRRIMRQHRRGLSALGLALCLIAVAGFSSRAGLLAVLSAMVVAYLVTLAAYRNPARKLNWIVLAPVLLAAAVFIVPTTDGGQRLLATVGVETTTTARQQGAIGTANARERSWEQIIEWTGRDTTRALIGVGYGPDFLAESGAEVGLSGTQYEGVRSPHNWLVGVYARTGILGLGITLFVLAVSFAHMWRIRRTIGSSELLTLSASGIIAIIIVAVLGVVLESPFGAVPFWWFLGILLSERRLGRMPAGSHGQSNQFYNPYRDTTESRRPASAVH